MNSKSVIFGIVHDNPQTTPPENCRYDACILLADKHFPAGSNIQYGEIAGGKYMVFTVNDCVYRIIRTAIPEVSGFIRNYGYFH